MKYSIGFLFVFLFSTASLAQDKIVIERRPVVKIYTHPHNRYYGGPNLAFVDVGVRGGRVVNFRHGGWRHPGHYRHFYRDMRRVAWTVRAEGYSFRDRYRNNVRRVE